ncbi:Rhomboid-like protein [Caenorhabditis elegans]|uniref:Rhomboid-like protein n=1 Tax=Caenorhabditis elegans TaxID=6239 RepID=Q2YS42_CAEEL|nr:Rhomboid-like protein [Caenorhabditis elegans]CAJ43915.1 Rhomboid-like protein [Caenorhabditis elegans]|eukprot:NP_001041014.1 Rhomboid-like protein [Caenorhabditis elegans]
MPAPELEAYHPDIAQSPPTSAKLAAPSKSSPFPYETAKISVVPEVVGYHQAGNISYIDVGDSTINRPKPTVLGERQALVASKRPDRVLMFYVLISTIVLSFLLFILFVVFFGNVQFDCPWCIYFNCLPVFECHNQGQKLKKWLPI